ncbi:MAG TPA: RNA methyltransferase [Terracidiphilus sp.]|nr:RNA methyltransferase [Terracidiphilus sp.]
MPIRIVQSKQNARLKELRKALAYPGREGCGLAGIEGPNLLKEALRAGLRIDCVFTAQGTDAMREVLALPPETEILALPKELLDSALTTEAPQSIAALVEPPDWTWAHIVGTHVLGGTGKSPALVVVLDGLQDPGNLGAILRSAEAFGADGVICLPGTVSAWNPKAVRASAGSIFRLPILAVSAQDCFARLLEAGVKIWTTTVKAAQPANLVDLTGPVALLIGNEGNGVSDHLAAQATGRLTIPCPGPVESLNASVAASVLLYEAARQRFERSGGPTGQRGGPR